MTFAKRFFKMLYGRARFGLVLTLLVAIATSCKEAEKWIASYGFSPLRPPSTLMAPGAMIIRKRASGKATKIVCSATDSLGPSFVPSHSKTVTGKFSRSRKVGYHVGADVLSQIHAKTNSDMVSEVYVLVTNARVVTLSDTDVLQNIDQRSRACEAAIRSRIDNGYDVSMIRQALIADVQYQVKYKKEASLDASAKIDQVQQVALTLGGNVASVTEDNATATDLVWGVQDSMFLASIGVEDGVPLTEKERRALKRRTMLSPADVLRPADAPQSSPDATLPGQRLQTAADADAPLWCPQPIDEDEGYAESAEDASGGVEPADVPLDQPEDAAAPAEPSEPATESLAPAGTRPSRRTSPAPSPA